MQLENLNNDKLRYVARMPRIPTPYARYINLHARVRINSSRYIQRKRSDIKKVLIKKKECIKPDCKDWQTTQFA